MPRIKKDLLTAMRSSTPVPEPGDLVTLPSGRRAQIKAHLDNGQTLLLTYHDDGETSELTLSRSFVQRLVSKQGAQA